MDKRFAKTQRIKPFAFGIFTFYGTDMVTVIAEHKTLPSGV